MVKPIYRNLVTTLGGTLVSQIIVLAFSPIITRLFDPEVFGLHGFFLSLISVLSPLVALRLHLAVTIAKTEIEADQIASLAIFLGLVTSTILAVVLGIGNLFGFSIFGLTKLGWLLWFLPPALFFIAIRDVIEMRLARLSQFSVISSSLIVQSLLSNLMRVVGGIFIAPTTIILVMITSIIPVFHSAILLWASWQQKYTFPSLSWKNAIILLKKYQDFPRYRVPTDIIGALSQSFPVLMLTWMFSPGVVGFYVLARSVTNLPLNIVGGSIGKVYYSHFALMYREKRPIFWVVFQATLAHFIFLAVPLLLISPTFPSLFKVVFGSQWEMAGQYAAWMAMWIAGMLVNIPSVRVLPLVRKQNVHLYFNVLFSIAGPVAIIASQSQGSHPLAAVAWFSSLMATLYAIQIVFYLGLLYRHETIHRK